MYVFRELAGAPWFTALLRLQRALEVRDAETVRSAYVSLYAALAEAGSPDLVHAAAYDLCYLDSSLARVAMSSEVPNGLLEGARHDLERVLALLKRDWAQEAGAQLDERVPPLAALAPPVADVMEILEGDAEAVLSALVQRYRRDGAGHLARDWAFRWTGQQLAGIAHIPQCEAQLVGVERPLAQLAANTEAFLDRRGAQHALLYGPRGSGKSTAVRNLLPRYGARELRLVELPGAHLSALPHVVARLRGRPHRYIVFADDLSFGRDDTSYAPLKTVLEGSLAERPENVLVYATSNRRHLVAERFSDRPDPISSAAKDDVHAWDTQHERLALADRFGLTLTFPSATQSRYLDIVRALAAQKGVAGRVGDALDVQALRFAAWGNGYSGRTAQQFVDGLEVG